MKNIKNFQFALIVLALSTLACQAVTSGGATELPPVEDPDVEIPTVEALTVEIPTAEPPFASGSDIIFADDFSYDQWGTGTDSDSAVEYVNNALNFIVFTENYFVWSTPDADDYQDVHMEVTVINNDTDSTTAFGLMCDKSASADFYYVAITPAGQYAIAKAATGQTDVFLTNNDEWAESGLIAVNADSYRVGMDCGNGTITLYVDGVEIASVNDSSYTSGQVAVMVWSGEDVGLTTNVSFDDFVVTELP